MSTSTAIAGVELPTPKLFISYSWSGPEHQDWVLELAEQLMEKGIQVILDKWDLQPGHDAFAFMELMVTDPAVTKVLIICDKKYAEKSNARAGGAGTEAQIITPEIYAKKAQDKFAAVVRERDADGGPYLPVYYKGRIFIDLSDISIYATELDKLLRWAWDKPLNIKPPLGKPPSFVTEEATTIKMATSVPFRRAIDALRNNRANAVPATVEFLDTVISGMGAFRIAATQETIETFDDIILKNIEDFLPYHSELVELFMTIASYHPDQEMIEALHQFFERLMPFTQTTEDKNYSFDVDCDNIKFIINELFLNCIGSFIKYERFTQAAFFMENEYYYAERFSKETMRTYSFFHDYIKSFEQRNERLKLNRISLRAELLKQRAASNGLDFKFIMVADFILYLRSDFSGPWSSWWYPEALIYTTFRSRLPFEICARSKSAKYFERVKRLFGVKDKTALEARILKIESDPRNFLPRWNYESLNPRMLLQLDAISTTD